MRDFLKNIYNVNVDQILTAVMNEYTDYRHTGENKMVNRDTLLAIFSDARVSAPVVKTASLHAEGKEPNQAYLYVFRHVTKKGYYPQVILTFDLHLPYHHSSFLIFFHLIRLRPTSVLTVLPTYLASGDQMYYILL